MLERQKNLLASHLNVQEHGRYNLSFTASSLRPELARIIAETYQDCRDWDDTKTKVLAQNSLQSRTLSSRIRMELEIRQRVQMLTPDQIELLAQAPSDGRIAITWLSMLKRSRFVFDFAAEVLRSKLDGSDLYLRPSDYESFWSIKSVTHPELAGISKTTHEKIRQVLHNMLREAGILSSTTGDSLIARPVIPHDAMASIIADDRKWLAGFLVPDHEIVSMKGCSYGV